ncbi:hypothetical protein B0J17DRAFT_664159 [Rhizoctonia solani]|nr:hypothetical protein B0J17DRAFT_664159 [Rhizoctonia solani]
MSTSPPPPPGARSALLDPSLGTMPTRDATHLLGGASAGTPAPTGPKRMLESCPNLFQLLEVIEDHACGTTEKIVIGQESFGRLLNLLQPGCYKSISKIDLKSLDKLSIEPTGVYGDPIEIVTFLQNADYLDVNSAASLIQAIKSDGPAVLKTGLYLALNPNQGDQNSKSACVIFWPEETTWKDQLATPSVQHRRTMFMRYLTKLTDQVLTFVSPEQARQFDWGADPGRLIRVTGEQGTSSQSELFPQAQQEVHEELELELTVSPGFKIHVGPEYFPNGVENSEARLVPGEDNVGLLTVSRNTEMRRFKETLSGTELRKMIYSSDCPLQLGQVSAEDVAVLAVHGLRDKYSNLFETYDQRLRLLDSDRMALEAIEKSYVEDRLKPDKDTIVAEVHRIIKTIDNEIYPNYSAQMKQKYPLLEELPRSIQQTYDPGVVKDEGFQTLKSRWQFVRAYFTHNPQLSETQQNGCIDYIFNRLPDPLVSRSVTGTNPRGPSSIAAPSQACWMTGSDPFSDLVPERGNTGSKLKDPEFIRSLTPLESKYPRLSTVAQQIRTCLQRFLANLKDKVTEDQVTRVLLLERERLTHGRLDKCEYQIQKGRKQAFRALLQFLREAMSFTATTYRLWLDRVTVVPSEQPFGEDAKFICIGYLGSPSSTHDHYSIYPLEFASPGPDDRAQLGKKNLRFEFSLEEGQSVEFLQLIHDKCLAIISNLQWVQFYIGDMAKLKQCISTGGSQMKLERDALSGHLRIFALDQATRRLAIVHGQKDNMRLSIYIFDELLANLSVQGSPISLKDLYNQPVDIERLCFISGLGRNTSLQTDQSIVDAFQVPNSSSLLIAIVRREATNPQELLAFHWDSLEANSKGIKSAILSPCDGRRMITRLGGHGRVHIVSFSMATRAITSVALQATQGAAHFPPHLGCDQPSKDAAKTINNSLLDCHLEIWTQFPITPAVARISLTGINRRSHWLTFVSSTAMNQAERYLARMISRVKKITQKPISEALTAINVNSISLKGIDEYMSSQISVFKMGSFITELFCLIPMHLAVAKNNGFIPLKDGVWDLDYQRSLLGTDFSSNVDALSLGWYESVFQSYMANKPVRVISSMGRNYSLDHFADTPFAGSRMYATEGVWLSCTPTEEYLLVSLDFEGVHSIWSSSQEDVLLVLFNTAISNLMLFHNNFAVSRDITGLFTSVLAIIVKGVVNADPKDIRKEFSLKFQAIVEKERDQNFVTRLHRGRIQIISWPVITSPEFYTLFNHLHQTLDQQPFTHGSGGAFLYTLKTLMAKIKTSDWDSLNKNPAAHRAQQMMERLPNALCHGQEEEGPLKNMDTDEELPTSNEMPPLFVPEFSGANAAENEVLAEKALHSLIHTCGPAIDARHRMLDASYIKLLQNRLYETLDQRLSLVQEWMRVNTEHFPSDDQDIHNLTRKFDTAALGMRTAMRLCSLECSLCQLLCLRAYRHSGSHSCGTNHMCILSCEVVEDHSQREPCGLPAGHRRPHMCNVKAHLCGQECRLSKMGGCVWSCIKPLDHEGEHLCSTWVHLCGKPCDLRDVRQGNRGELYNCTGTCNKLWDEPHEFHVCKRSMDCPMECTLCRRLCSSTDHLHGLKADAVHLCGQEHNCCHLCESNGICQIETRPSASQEQFSGRHESFVYTIYTQVNRRLSCAIPIPPGQLRHDGLHTHDTDEYAFHFCDARCPNCEYTCTLPYGHSQRLHDTSHGSMVTTQWVLQQEGSANGVDVVYTLQEKKYAAGDSGSRHAHVDYCHNPDNCSNTQDWISHAAYWERTDPYSRDEQDEFSKWRAIYLKGLCKQCIIAIQLCGSDALYADPRHQATRDPVYCTLPIFHAPVQDRSHSSLPRLRAGLIPKHGSHPRRAGYGNLLR